MLNLKLYKTEILTKGSSPFVRDKEFRAVKHTNLPKTDLMEAFLSDDDIQEITYCSTNFGIVRTFQKQFRRH